MLLTIVSITCSVVYEFILVWPTFGTISFDRALICKCCFLTLPKRRPVDSRWRARSRVSIRSVVSIATRIDRSSSCAGRRLDPAGHGAALIERIAAAFLIVTEHAHRLHGRSADRRHE